MENLSVQFNALTKTALDLLDEEFNNYLAVAQALMSKIQSPHESNVCVKYIRQCCALQAPIISVKLNRNTFFQYFLEMLKKACILAKVN